MFAFGLPGYYLEPKMAELLLDRIRCLESVPLRLGRGFTVITPYGIDRILNLYFKDIGAEVILPPLALALNDPLNSLTLHAPDKFDESEI